MTKQRTILALILMYLVCFTVIALSIVKYGCAQRRKDDGPQLSRVRSGLLLRR
jgi:hypothetical protein